MQYLASGWQYDVYADGDRVIKRPSPVWRIATRIARNYPLLALRPARLLAKAKTIAEDRNQAVDGLFARDIDRSIVANAHMEQGVLVQDRVVPLEDCLRRGDDARPLIDAYIASIHASWAQGFADTSFNFTVNHGRTASGRVVILDLGELTFDRSEVARLIQVEFWKDAYSLITLPAPVRAYALESMRARLTRPHLMTLWQDAELEHTIPVADDRPPVERVQRTRRPEYKPEAATGP